MLLSYALNAQTITTVCTITTGYYPCWLTFDIYGNLYFSENLGNAVLKLDTTGIITTIAGTGAAGFSGDGGPATSAMLDHVCGVAVDSFGNIFIADALNYRIREVSAGTGIINTIAGNGSRGFLGDGGMASAATLSVPTGLCFDNLGDLYIGDGNRIRKIDTSGIISTIAGNASYGTGSNGDGGPATAAELYPFDIHFDNAGNLYIAEYGLARVRKINTAGIISTVAGDSSYIYDGDGIPATSANMDAGSVAVNNSGEVRGEIYISDYYNNRIRMVDDSGIVHTIAGNGVSGFSGAGGPATAAEISYPSGLAFDNCGNLYFGQVNNACISKIIFDTSCIVHSTEPLLNPNISYNGAVSVYPNPATSIITVNGSKKINQVFISNFIGQAIYNQMYDAEKAEVDVAGWPPGIYVVRVTEGDGNIVVRKVVKE